MWWKCPTCGCNVTGQMRRPHSARCPADLRERTLGDRRTSKDRQLAPTGALSKDRRRGTSRPESGSSKRLRPARSAGHDGCRRYRLFRAPSPAAGISSEAICAIKDCLNVDAASVPAGLGHFGCEPHLLQKRGDPQMQTRQPIAIRVQGLGKRYGVTTNWTIIGPRSLREAFPEVG